MNIASRVKYVVKRDGSLASFDVMRIYNAVKAAMVEVGQYDRKKLEKVVRYVVRVLNEKYGDLDTYPHVEEIQDIVELALMKNDLYDVAKAYIVYRKERERIRKEKMKILGKDRIDEVDKAFSLNAIRLLAARYLLKDENGRIVESPKEMFKRVAALVVIPDILYDERVFDREGRQKVHPHEDFNPLEYEGKLGLGRSKDGFEFSWNRYHLERMKCLYDELNNQGKMKLPWSKLLEMLLKGEFEDYVTNAREYYDIMVSKKFMPNSPTLFNAGTRLGQLSACFVLDIDDDMESIMKAAHDAAIIFKSGGGIGINYSKLRPEGDVVASTGGIASGPISFMKLIDAVTDVIKQGGRRRGACMGILEIWHPDIEKFITAKASEGVLTNHNISVMIDEKFWRHLKENKDYPLVNPRNGKVWKYIKPRDLFRMIAEMAWRTGDPGVLFKDNINKYNVLITAKGEINATNPCGEEPLYPYESCNLGSINLYAFVKFREDGGAYFDWEEYHRTIKLAYRFLDNIIDVNRFPLKEIEESTKASRKVGLGLMGLADTLYALRIPYNSEEGFEFMRKVAEHLTFYAMKESVERAKLRGVFPLYDRSRYPEGSMPVAGYYRRDLWTLPWDELAEEIRKHGIRNAEVTTIAPTGSISMLVDVSSGIEPQFALVYEKRVTVGSFFYVDGEFERTLKMLGLYSDRLLKKIAENGGSAQGIEEIPEDLQRVFVVAYDIPWWDHVRAQAEIQQWICSAVSKTINMPSWVSVEDVEKAYVFAHELGCKGITVYRDGSKGVQVLITPTQRKKRYLRRIENRTLEIMRSMGIDVESLDKLSEEKEVENGIKGAPYVELTVEDNNHVGNKRLERCPVCGSKLLIYEEGCVRCPECGWSACL